MVFTRLTYLALAHLGMTILDVELCPFGLLLDLIECWRHETGAARPYREAFIDEVIPSGI